MLQLGWFDLAAEWLAAAAPDGDDLRWVIRKGRIAAWSAIHDNDLATARSHYRQIIDYVEPDGARLWLLFDLADAIRLGHPALVAGHLDHLRGHMDGEAAPLLSAHAEALAEGDAEHLERISDRYGELGWRLRAAEPSVDAAGVHVSRGNIRAAARASTWAQHIAEHFTALTPPLARMPKGLTSRKRQIARLAAEGVDNREIADRLFLSVRTVENHLSKTYRILGIEGRGQLSVLLGPDRDPR